MEIRRIGVVGAGIMGGGIAEVSASHGFAVKVVDSSVEAARKGVERIRERLKKRAAEGKMTGKEMEDTLSRVSIGEGLPDLRESDLVIEAVIEKEEVKKEIFRELDRLCPPETIFSTNTSSISITRLSSATKRPGRFAGMHFMNPAYIMKLVEVVRGRYTAEETIDAIKAVSVRLEKTPVVVNDRPGFVANRVLMPMINEAVKCLEEGVGPKEAVDEIMRLGANHPMGPLELADFIGLDTCVAIMEVLSSELGEAYAPCRLLKDKVREGKLGRKTGEGFYEYGRR